MPWTLARHCTLEMADPHCPFDGVGGRVPLPFLFEAAWRRMGHVWAPFPSMREVGRAAGLVVVISAYYHADDHGQAR